MREEVHPQLRILSLDGGETRCVSQLEILREFMHRLKMDTGVEYRPSDYFHWIGGVGAGGVIAMLLVTFRMDIEEALATFARICTSVLSDDCSPAERASKLEAVTRELLEEHNKSPETKLLDESDQSISCKLGLFYMSAVNLSHCALFRNYASRQASHNPTVVQAIRAVWATPGMFSSIHIGPGNFPEEIVSAVTGFNNPILEVLKEAHSVFGPDATVSCLLSLGAGRAPIRSISSDGLNTSKILEQLAMDCEKTAEEAGRRIGRLDIYFRFSVDRGLEFDTPHSPIESITAHTGQYLLDEGVSNGLDGCIRSCEKKGRATLEQLYHARTKISTSLRGLPPLSSYFVMRQEPMKVLMNTLVDTKKAGQRLAVVCGMGGSGKTQLTLKFARDFEDSYQVVMFIDASSIDNIKKGLLTRVRALERGYKPETVEDALEILSDAEDRGISNWLIIYDNADDPELDLRLYIPMCDHGAVLISTRNTMLQHMAPEGYLELDMMSPAEAITALLQAALPSGVKPTPRDRTAAEAIARQLGHLPIAIIQAGCYIRQHHCLYGYEDRLKSNRKATLERPAKNQRDALKYGHSVYASLDITVEALSTNALHILSLLSFAHFAEFPQNIFSLAASSGFKFESLKILDRPADFQRTVDLLSRIFCPNGSWDEDVLNDALEELQQYSLVAVAPSVPVITLRLHPLVHGWAQDRLPLEDQEMYRAAVVRLLACGAGVEESHIYDYLTPHVMSLFHFWPALHVNDRSAFLKILRNDSDIADANLVIEQSRDIYEQLKSTIGSEDIRTTRAAYFLAEAYYSAFETSKAYDVVEEVVRIRESLLGREDLETVEAMMGLAVAYEYQERHKEAEVLVTEVLSVRSQKLGDSHKDVADAMELIATIYTSQGRHVEAEKLLKRTIATRTTLLGRTHQSTLSSTKYLADCLDKQGRYTEADTLRQELMTCVGEFLGPQHIDTLSWSLVIGLAYSARRQFALAEKYCERAVAGLIEGFGPTYSITMEAILLLAFVYETEGRLSESESRFRELLQYRRKVEGNYSRKALVALTILARVVDSQGRRTEARILWEEEMEGRKMMTTGEMTVELLDLKTISAPIFDTLGRFEELETLAAELVEERKQLQGEDHPDTLDAIQWVARAKLERKEHKAAEAIFQELLEKRQKIQGEKQLTTIHLFGWLSRTIEEQGRLDDAVLLSEKKVALLSEALGSKDEQVVRASAGLVTIYLKLGRVEDANKVVQTMIQVTNDLGPLDPLVFTSQAALAWVLHHQGKFDEAAALSEQVLEKRIALWGNQHRMVAYSKTRLAITYEAMGKYDEAMALAQQALIVQRELLWPGHEMLEDTINLLEKLEGRPNVTSDPSGPSESSVLATPPPRRPPIRGESIDIDGYISPGDDSPVNTTPTRSFARPFVPFQQRNKFGRAPNSWSMFL